MNKNQDLTELTIKFSQAWQKRQARLEQLRRSSDRMLRWLLDNEDTSKRYSLEVRADMSRGELCQAILTELGFDEMIEFYGDQLNTEYGVDVEGIIALLYA
jgi:hypothetical protein